MGKSEQRWGRWDLVLAAIGILPLLAGIVLYDKLPDQVASHYDLHGNVNGYQSKPTFILMLGLLTIGLPILMKLLRYADPQRANYQKFNNAFEIIRCVMTLFVSIIFTLILLFNLGFTFSMQTVLLCMMGVLFMILGNYMGQFRFNYSMGIRTPWTLANDEVWRKTHRLAGPLWVIAGVIAIIAAFLPGIAAAWVFGLGLGVAVLLPTLYSYLLFRRLTE